MAGIGVPELVLIFLVVVVLFGATRLPQLGKGIGEGIANLKKGLRAGEEKALPGEKEEDPKA
jgi:sec-independent protein translocase protein TatA